MTLFVGASAHASLVHNTYWAQTVDAGVMNTIYDVGNVTSGLASASVSDTSLSAGYTGTGTPTARANMTWLASADTTFRLTFDYAITNASSFQVMGLNLDTFAVPFNIITASGSGHFDQTLSLLTGEQLFIEVKASGPGTVNVTNINSNASAVPIPAAVWLLGSGLIGLVGLRRRFQK
jgi:hypothetical protein